MNISPAVLATVPIAPPASQRMAVPEKAEQPLASMAHPVSAPQRAPFPHSPDLSELAEQLEPPERARQLALALEGPGLPIAFKLATLRMMLEGPGLAAAPTTPEKREASQAKAEPSDNWAPGQLGARTPTDAEVIARVEPPFVAQALWASHKTPGTSNRDPEPKEARSGSVPPSASAQALAKVASPPPKSSLDLKG